LLALAILWVGGITKLLFFKHLNSVAGMIEIKYNPAYTPDRYTASLQSGTVHTA